MASRPQKRGSGDLRRTLGLFRRFSAGERRSFVFAAVLLALEAATAVAVPALISHLTNFLKDDVRPVVLGFTPSMAATVPLIAAGIVAATAINSSSSSLAEISLSRAGRTLGFNLRGALFAHLQKLPLAFHLRRSTGDVLTRLTGDVKALEDFVEDSVSDLIGSVFVLAATLTYLFWQSWQVAVLAVVIVPLLTIVSNVFAARIKKASKQLRASEGDLASTAQEMLSAISLVQVYGSAEREQRKFASQSRSARDAVLRTARLEAVFGFTVSVMESLGIAVVILLGARLVAGNTISAGLLIAFILLIQGMFKPVRRIIKQWNRVAAVYASVERVGELLDREATVVDSPDARRAPPLRGDIEFRDVSFAYHAPGDDDGDGRAGRLALHSVSFRMVAGEVVALVGHSGAGKSTIAQLLPRLYDPHAGAVLIDGYDIRQFTLESLRSQMSMVLQETVLLRGTVAENIAYGREDATREDVIRAATQANAHDFVMDMPDGYDTVLGERAATLSGGQRQRLAIARAFIRDAPILILDEPTTGLDAESSDLVAAALQDLTRNRSTVIVSHDFNLIRSVDRVLVISAGRILEEGSPADLLESGGLYADLYARQFGEAMAPTASPPQAASLSTAGAFAAVDRAGTSAAARAGAGADTASRAGARGRADVAGSADIRGGADVRGGADIAARAGSAEKSSGMPLEPPGQASRISVADEFDLDGGEPVERERFETALTEAVPLPASKDEFLSLAGWVPPPPEPSAAADDLPAGFEHDPLRSPVLARVVPGLVEALSPAAMAPRLEQLLFDDWELTSCLPGKPLVEPGTGASVQYRLELRLRGTGERAEAVVAGRLFPVLDLARGWLAATEPLAERLEDRADLAMFSRLAVLVPELSLVLHAFPLDPALPGLVLATDAAELMVMLGPALTSAVEGLVLHGCGVEVVRYRRGSCVLRYELVWRLQPSRRTLKQVVYGKVYGDGRGALVGPAVTALRRESLGGRRALPFLVPRFQAYLPDLRLALLEAVPGAPKLPALIRARAGAGVAPAPGNLTARDAVRAAAGIAAALHETSIPTGPARTFAGELDRARAEVEDLAPLAPALASVLHHHLNRPESLAADVPMASTVAHGDFDPSQVLFDGPTSSLVDFDTVCLAEPALDLGEFTGHLAVTARRAEEAVGIGDGAEALEAAFLREYLRQRDCEDADLLLARTGAYRTIALVRLAVRSWCQLKPQRLRPTLTLLDRRQHVRRL